MNSLAIRFLIIGIKIAVNLPQSSVEDLQAGIQPKSDSAIASVEDSQASIPSTENSLDYQPKRDLMEDIGLFYSFHKHQNPQNLSLIDFAQNLSSQDLGPIEKLQINDHEVIFRRIGYRDYIYAWFHPKTKLDIVEIETESKDALIQLLNNFPLIGTQPYSLENLLHSWSKRVNDIDSARKAKLEKRNNWGERPTESTIIYTEEGYMGDSLNGKKIIIKLQRPRSSQRPRPQWDIISIQRLTICHIGRGSQFGTTRGCI